MSVTEKNHPDVERTLSRRRQVLEAAEACFGRSGFHGASMAEISKQAGMSAGHIYNYFNNKDAIIAAFVQHNLERTFVILRDIEQHADTLEAALDELGKGVHANLDPGSWKLQLEIFAEASRNPKIAAMLQEADCAARTLLRKILATGRGGRGLTIEEDMLDGRCEAIISLMQGLHLRALHNPTLDEAQVTAAIRLAVAPLLFAA